MEFIKGMDISFLPEMLDQGAIFYDEVGREREVFELLKENGVNSIRLRIWNNPENVPQSGGYCDLKQTVAMAKKIKQHGMTFFLDFHYSDWWADPGKQNKPKAWENLNFEELKQAVYDYTKDVLLEMEREDVFPDMIQIGNEIRSGMLFPDGEVPHFDRLVQLVNSGIRAVRDIGVNHGTKVVIHLDQGGRYYYLRDWFDSAFAAGLDDFDIIGVSYYPFWHGTFTEFKDTLVQMIERYNKPIVVAETAHAWRRTDKGFIGEQQEKAAGFPATPDAQYTVMELVMNIVASLEQDMGLGIYYWEPVVIPIQGKGGWSSNMGVFDEKGRALPALSSFRFTGDMYKPDEIAKIYEPDTITEVIGNRIKFPQTVRVLYFDGHCEEQKVEWEPVESLMPSSVVVQGVVSDIGRTVSVNLELVEKLEEDYNYIPDENLDNGLEGWTINRSNESVTVELHPDFIDPFPAPPINHVYVKSPMNFTMELYKELDELLSGTYCLSVEYRGANTTGVDVRLFAKTEDNGIMETVIFPTDEDWKDYQLSGIVVKNRKVRLGISISSPPVFGRIRRFRLTKHL